MAIFDGSSRTIVGTDGDDTVRLTEASGESAYTIGLKGGNDLVFVDSDDYVPFSYDGGTGADTVRFGTKPVWISLESGSFSYRVPPPVRGSVSNVENVIGSSEGDRIIGDAGNNLVRGGTGADRMDGRGGIDTLDYSDSGAGVSVTLGGTASGGTAQGDINVNFERIRGSVYGDVLAGDAGRNALFGYGGDDGLAGGDRSDTLAGMAGGDTLRGGTGADLLDGSFGNDVLLGQVGADTLLGGAGADRLTGGAGADTFVFASLDDTQVWSPRDRITDFATGDRIDLSAIDAVAATPADDAFRFLGDRSFDGSAGALRAAASSTGVTLLGDVDGDRKIDFAIDLDGVSTLHKVDFIL